MANLNARQTQFLSDVKTLGKTFQDAYSQAQKIAESYDEEFGTSQDNDLATADDLEATYFFDAADVAAAVNQTVDNFINFWDGDAVTTREYGKDMRRVI